jgi:transcriptional regulator with XRE-family HTH domain
VAVTRPKGQRRWRSAARAAPELLAAVASLGKRIRELRLDRGLSQEKAALLARIDPKHWQTIERGTTNATVATLIAIAGALNVELGELFDGV